jgi:hypothetical protein
MKARQEFSSHEDYKDYMRHYYAGLAMSNLVFDSMTATEFDAMIEDSVKIADALLAKLSN